MEQKDCKNDAGSPPEESSNPQSSEKNGSNKVTNHPEGSSKPQVSGNKSSTSLKAKRKIVKKSKAGKLKAMNEGSQQIGGKTIKKNKKVVGNSDEPAQEKSKKEENNEVKQIQNGSTGGGKSPIEKSTEAKKNKEKEIQNGSTSGKSPKEKSEKDEKNKEKEIQNGSTSGKSPTGKRRRPRPRRNKMAKLDKNEQKPKNEERQRESDKGARSRINKTKSRATEKPESSEENVAGFIFMCNSKTKPDCFNYRVMGVSMGKKEVVLGIKPGAKLFLYDFDLKLLYGVYKASSSGGMKLEPRAFGGNFPAQVRFSIASDCVPLPESIFKKAIKENYDAGNRFKTELTTTQVRKLIQLFKKPADIRSAIQPVRSPPKSIIRDREAYDSVRGSRSRLHREIPNVLSHERDLRIERREEAPRDLSRLHREIPNVLSHERDLRIERREEAPRDLFLTEKSYRTYGLQGVSQVKPIIHSYERDYEREHHPHLDPNYRRNAPARGAEPLHFSENDHRTYYQGATSDHVDDHYHASRYRASRRDPYQPPLSREEIPSRDPYLPPLSREEIPSRSYLVGGRTLVGNENLQRREVVADRLYSTYSAADALSEYNRRQHYHEENLEASTVPVSSRYSFGGPSYSLR